jgi:PAS domain S-box-containing protein
VKTPATPPNTPDEELHRFFEVSLDMLCIAGKDGYFKRINAAWERTLGHSVAELLAEPYLSFVHPDDRQATIDEAQKISEGEDTIWFENRYRCSDGSYRWLFWRATAPLDSPYIYAAARDITDHKAASEALARTAGELKRSNAELDQFASIASHDLQEPLRMITSYLGLLQRRARGKLDAEAEQFIGFAVDGAVRMRTLLDALLGWSRVATRARPLALTNLDSILAGVLRDLHLAIEESGARITHDPLPTVTVDPAQIAQHLHNLLANAIKFRGRETPRIHLSAEPTDGGWHFTVRDNGIGIDPKHFDRIFTIFQRLHTRDEYPGTGIGLAVCKKIVERHDGKIWIESAPGAGATFHFTIGSRAR